LFLAFQSYFCSLYLKKHKKARKKFKKPLFLFQAIFLEQKESAVFQKKLAFLLLIRYYVLLIFMYKIQGI